MKSNHYYFGDVKTQAALLQEQIQGINASLQAQHIKAGGDPSQPVPGLINSETALRRMYRRVARFYGLNNKYDANGNLRKAA